ncbi:nickel transporter [Tateyamaria omphalii]|uniref:Hpt domain-containing protein n=1 Tax=Tateyamaria omphalii TaxID=299262 RepID=UPI00167525D0|nr:Hpt domain-containing protein [Tateyamaria omphalii]GGX39958.1 nickel transporter [Tateyamaria omphalii]
MIDWDRVTTLRAEIGEDDFEEVVPLFIEEVTEIIDGLRAGPDLSRLEDDLHALKGSALNLGFTDFSILCHKGEAMSARGKAAEVDVSAIVDSFDASKTAFTDGLASPPTA